MNFECFAPYQLSGVKESGRELGRGSYAAVLELDYMGLKCAGKKIHNELRGETSYAVVRFKEECRLLSQMRHPNIVQFLGVCFFQEEILPILVMEFLPTNLTSCIEQHGNRLLKEIMYSILHDVALGLCYLHSQTPPIVHRDLSANNVLLTPNMTAKISDLGVAKMLNLTPLQVSRMTGTPGTPAYMPPEAMVANPKYDMSVDVFSFGALLIHVLSGKWPEPQIGPNQIDPKTDRLVPVSEAERRETLLESIGHDHPLMDLILKCIDNNPKHRPPSSNIVESLKEMKSTFLAPFANQLEMLARIEADEEEKRIVRLDLETKLQVLKQKEKQITILEAKLEGKDVDNSKQIEQLRLALSAEVEQQRLLNEDLLSQIQGLHAEKQSISQSAQSTQNEKEVLAAQMSKYNQEMNATLKSFEEKHHQERQKQQQLFAEEKQQYERALEEERDLHNKASVQISALQAEVHMLKSNEECFKSSLAAKDDIIASKNSELEVKAKVLQQKDATLSGMSEQLTSARQFLATTKQVFFFFYNHTECA